MLYQVYIGVLVLLILNVKEGTSISCYSCSSKNNESCYKPDLSLLKPVHCDMKTLDETKWHAGGLNKHYLDIFDVDLLSTIGQTDLVCLKVIIKDGNKDFILRGCQLGEQRHLDICNRLEKSNTDSVRKVFCSKCNNEDGCNSSPKTYNFNALLAFVCTVICKIFYM